MSISEDACGGGGQFEFQVFDLLWNKMACVIKETNSDVILSCNLIGCYS